MLDSLQQTEPRANDDSAAPQSPYRALSRMAVWSLVFGVLSAATVLHWALGAVPLVGIALGWTALGRIRETPGEMTGRGLACAGVGLSVAFAAAGYGWQALARASRVPHGYQEVTYEMLQPDPRVPDELIPPAALKLKDKKVYVEGYMAPTRQMTGLKQFVLCPSVPGCPFCIPSPKPTEMILVTLQGDLTADYTTRQIGLGGKFGVEPAARNGLPYRLEADCLR